MSGSKNVNCEQRKKKNKTVLKAYKEIIPLAAMGRGISKAVVL